MSDKKDTADKKKEEPKTPGQKSSLLPVLGLVFGLVNLGGTGFVAFKVLTLPTPEAAHKEEVATKSMGPTTEMDAMVVNLNETGTPRYLRTKLLFELRSAEALTEVDPLKPVLRDEILRYLSSLTVQDTLGEANKQRISKEMLARIHESMGNDNVKRLMFNEFVVQ